ncbi:molybdopterin-dependent oxidoreductase [Actinomadura scrupuli]|uniref:molybdopterin-dependent oxidoreductase n=1 Tax=Actinomadura scrupuli TaxID=559629 RepID=UPI003D9A0841
MVRHADQVKSRAGEVPRVIASRFGSRLHDEGVAAWLGVWLGVSFTLTFVTGLISHFMQHPPEWLLWPARPVNLYRFTQGLHVIGGLATIPLLLAKLWTVYPRLWQWPPVRSAAHALERSMVFLLVAGALFQLATGVLNVARWYVFPFSFPATHYWTSYILVGALVIHVTNEWAKVRRTVFRPVRLDPVAADSARGTASLTRRGFFATTAAACGVIAATTVGEAFRPLARIAWLAPLPPRRGVPVNRTAAAARVTVRPDWRLHVTGAVQRDLSLSLEELRALPRHSARLPIACVEGWSAEGAWAGVRLRDLLRMAGAADDARVRVESLEPAGRYRTSEVRAPHWHDPLTLLALELDGAPLTPDHGHPCRLIAPDRPGVLQTKWVTRVVVL